MDQGGMVCTAPQKLPVSKRNEEVRALPSSVVHSYSFQHKPFAHSVSPSPNSRYLYNKYVAVCCLLSNITSKLLSADTRVAILYWG
ncbi:hypothetical protein BaRGS_00006697 [Batillaria attramentaria]|uniref:Uncharacterized protein n=1 Tax=Batillaria attramentaria TaxID=370345 RepID=A0ABD0LRP5_9CAEN